MSDSWIMTPHFYKAKSRLGMMNVPFGEKELNLGVEFGSDSILTEEYVSKFAEAKTNEFIFTNPEDIQKNDYANVIAKESRAFSDLISKTIQENEVQVTVGGDHSVAFTSILSILDTVNSNDLGIIYIDSHADLHKFSTSPSGNFHGMHMRAVMDHEFDSVEIRSLFHEKYLRPQNIIYIGNMTLEDEEVNFIKEKKIMTIDKYEMLETPGAIESPLKSFITRFKHIRISFDIDVFNSKVVTATGIKNPNGFMWDDIDEILTIIKEGLNESVANLSIDLVEVNPKKEGAEETVKIAQKVLYKLLDINAGTNHGLSVQK